jgi:hypothetical protein
MQSIGQEQQENFSGDAILFRLFQAPRARAETSAHRTAIVVRFVVATRGEKVNWLPKSTGEQNGIL